MPKIDLLPCPFCGRKPKTIELHIRLHQISCLFSKCPAHPSVIKKTPEKAAKAWNTRASGWISCSDMMPKKDGYFICASNGEIKILPYRNGEFYSECFDGALRCCNSSVTHWMPIPELPKEE